MKCTICDKKADYIASGNSYCKLHLDTWTKIAKAINEKVNSVQTIKPKIMKVKRKSK